MQLCIGKCRSQEMNCLVPNLEILVWLLYGNGDRRAEFKENATRRVAVMAFNSLSSYAFDLLKIIAVISATFLSRAAWNLLHMVFIYPLSDPLRLLPGPDAARFLNHFRELMEYVVLFHLSETCTDLVHFKPKIQHRYSWKLGSYVR